MPDAPQTEPTSEVTQSDQSVASKTKPKKRSAKGKWLIMLVLLVALGAAGMYAYQNYYKPAPAPTEVKVVRKTVAQATTFKDGVKWLGSAQALPDLKLFNQSDSYFDLKYFKVGSDAGNDVVLVSLPRPISRPDSALLVKTASGYQLLRQHASGLYDQTGTYIGPGLAPGVSVNSAKVYDSVAYQKNLKLDKAIVTSPADLLSPYSDYLPAPATKDQPARAFTKFAATPYGQLYTRELGSGSGFTVQDFVLQMLDQQATNYQLRPSFVTDDNVPQLKWNNGSANKDTYRTDGIGGCGSAVGLAVMNSSSLDGLAASGKTSAGETVYEFTDAANPTLKYFYNSYANDPGTNKPISSAISLTAYQAKHGVFVYRDVLGRSVIFTSTTYGSQAECGKPVIYLYPTKPAQVLVKVDAYITKSDPAYGNGWLVNALPDGSLMTGGRTYDSLFWEGIGHEYPAITSGFVVSQDSLVQTVTDQLHQLGLSAKETADFLAFWQPRLPKTPYVRLSWLGTADMNRLAPLHIQPAPDTLIRVFLDFEGLTSPIPIQPQNLGSVPRHGFTVIEWGGLLRK